MSKSDLIQIGQLANKSGVNIQTIRYYERRGLIKPKRIKESGYRLYDEGAVRTISFIKQAKELGFSLKEIDSLIKLRSPSKANCAKVKDRAGLKLQDVREKLGKLKKMEKSLLALIDDCAKEQTFDVCPIITALES